MFSQTTIGQNANNTNNGFTQPYQDVQNYVKERNKSSYTPGNINDTSRSNTFVNGTFNQGRSLRVMSVREILTDETGMDALQAFSDEAFN